MLQTTSQYKYFAQFGIMDGGLEFLSAANVNKKSSIDAHGKGSVHFCSCNK